MTIEGHIDANRMAEDDPVDAATAAESDDFTSLPVHSDFVEVPQKEDEAFKAVRRNDLKTVEQELNNGFDINARHVEEPDDRIFSIKDWSRMVRGVMLKQYTLLHVAVIHGNMETIQFLLSHGADINQTDVHNRSPLYFAAAVVRPDVVKLFIEKGANLNMQSGSGRTALIEAITNRSLTIVHLLIESGADLDLADTKGVTPLLSCLTFDRNLKVDVLKALIEGGCKIDLPNKQGATPLMTAVGLGKIESVKELLKAGADINKVDKAGKTVFHMAAGVKTALFLLNNGATIDSADKRGERPFDKAVHVGHIGMVRLLLEADCRRSTAILDVPRMIQARQSVPIFDRWLLSELYNPRSLKRLCRQTIRECLAPANTAHVSQLPIPSLLKDFLWAKHLDLTFDSVLYPDPLPQLNIGPR